jgi:hypothetical protein
MKHLVFKTIGFYFKYCFWVALIDEKGAMKKDIYQIL